MVELVSCSRLPCTTGLGGVEINLITNSETVVGMVEKERKWNKTFSHNEFEVWHQKQEAPVYMSNELCIWVPQYI